MPRLTARERTTRRRIVRTMFRCLRTGDLPRIVLKRFPPLDLAWPPWHHGDYTGDTDTLRAWLGNDFEDTIWHEAVHAVEARLGLEYSEPRAEALARHLKERYELPDLTLEWQCPCGADVYLGLEVCLGCGAVLEWPFRIPKKRRGRSNFC